MSETEKGQTFTSIFENRKISVPAYQRAYAWEEKQLEPFINDLLEFQDKAGEYYFGHFILEEKDNVFELVDGQQRMTTFMLFLIVCNYMLKKENKSNAHLYQNWLNNFSTVDYDSVGFTTIQSKIDAIDSDWKVENFFSKEQEVTESLKRMIAALEQFRKAFSKDKKLQIANIEEYLQVILQAHASAHIVAKKAVAVQVFELHNTRGIRLNTIEKVKAKLMKAVYQHSEGEDTDKFVTCIQNYFAKIYELEEQTSASSFRGELELDVLLLNHLRVIDDGTKTGDGCNANILNEPSRNGPLENRILEYLDKKLTANGTDKGKVVEYALNLSKYFLDSVCIMCKYVPAWDKDNSLVGDVLILEKALSCEFFLIVCNLFANETNSEVSKFGRIEICDLLRWEQLLFTRDFHDCYHNLQWRDNFPYLFYEIIKNKNECSVTLQRYVENGFRTDKTGQLQLAFKTYVEKYNSHIKNNAYGWHTQKMAYILYKYEKSKGVNLNELRKIVKDGISLEHILPQNWQYDWVSDDNAIGVQIEKKIEPIIDGIGNLLILSRSQNSWVSDNHPEDKAEKYLELGLGGSYADQINKDWGNPDKWESIITKRSDEIYKFMQKYFIEGNKNPEKKD